MIHQTTKEMDQARSYNRGERIPKSKLAIMDAETERLVAESLTSRALMPGAKVPDFILPDAHGKQVRLQSLLNHGPVVVVFYRGGWCPYCNVHLHGFQRVLPELKNLKAHLVAISPQLPDHSLNTQEKNNLKFPVLSDVGNKVAHQFGITFQLSDALIQLYKEFDRDLHDINGKDGAKELPVPATFVIDSGGIIRQSHVDVDYTHRLDPDDVIETLKRINAQPSLA